MPGAMLNASVKSPLWRFVQLLLSADKDQSQFFFFFVAHVSCSFMEMVVLVIEVY